MSKPGTELETTQKVATPTKVALGVMIAAGVITAIAFGLALLVNGTR